MKVSIVGLADSCRSGIPTDTKLWALAWDRELAAHSDLVFEIHERNKWSEGHADRLNDLGLPIVLAHAYEDISRGIRFPLERAIDAVGDYFDSSVAYMLAFAILQKASWIGLYGVTGAEVYQWQRPNLEYLIGFARGRGIEVFIHPESGQLLKPAQPGRYGFGAYNGKELSKERVYG